MKHKKTILDLIGNTPIAKLASFTDAKTTTVLAKLESFNPGGSIKDRIALSMIEDAEKQGKLTPGSTIIEPTSGNTGVGLALVSAVKGYTLILTMPETMSIERRNLLKLYGAKLELTPGEKGMQGAIDRAESLNSELEGSIILQQFNNPSNPEIHRQTTAKEIWDDTNGDIDIFVAGVGTGGTITGVGEVLKQKNPNIQIIAVEPKDSAVLSGGTPGPHKIQGIGAGFIPNVLNTDIIDDIIQVSNEDAFNTARQLALKEGILCGISAGANAFAALQLASKIEHSGKTIVFIVPDTGERYLSTL